MSGGRLQTARSRRDCFPWPACESSPCTLPGRPGLQAEVPSSYSPGRAGPGPGPGSTDPDAEFKLLLSVPGHTSLTRNLSLNVAVPVHDSAAAARASLNLRLARRWALRPSPAWKTYRWSLTRDTAAVGSAPSRRVTSRHARAGGSVTRPLFHPDGFSRPSSLLVAAT